MVEKVLGSGKKHRIAVASAQDDNTIAAIGMAVSGGFAEAILVGDSAKILSSCKRIPLNPKKFRVVHTGNEEDASREAVRLTRENEADVVMKGMVGTDIFLKAVMDKENGIMIPGAVLTYVGAIELAGYRKLLFVTDPAVIPYPGLDQKTAMINYALEMTREFGICKPRIALMGASEKASSYFHYSADYSALCRLAKSGGLGDCIVDGPLDLFLACDPESVRIKGIDTPVAGDADILLFPSLESCNPFYKSLMLFGKGMLAGLVRGTSKPVIVMSRSESERSKYYCIALSCLMA